MLKIFFGLVIMAVGAFLMFAVSPLVAFMAILSGTGEAFILAGVTFVVGLLILFFGRAMRESS